MQLVNDLLQLANPLTVQAALTIQDRSFDAGKLRQAHSKINDALQCGGFYHAETIERMRRCKRALYKLITWLEYKAKRDAVLTSIFDNDPMNILSIKSEIN